MIVLSVVFALGFLATRAEPALRVMGKVCCRMRMLTYAYAELMYADAASHG